MLSKKEVGNSLEKRVMKILALLGKKNIRQNVFLKDSYGNRSEIDVTYEDASIFSYFSPRKRTYYVECKAYNAETTTVPLEDVAKFKSVLELNRIPISRGLFVTTSTYTPRASTLGIRTIDKDQLVVWEKEARSRARRKRIMLPIWILLASFSGCLILELVPVILPYLPEESRPIMLQGHRVWKSQVDWIQIHVKQWIK
jgi:Restriction endonuclease